MIDTIAMTTIEAIKYVKEHFEISTKSELARSLSDDTLTVQPIQITRYLKGSKMSQKVAKRFYETYGIIITDSVDKAEWKELIGMD